MTASYNISFLGSPEHAESQKGKKGKVGICHSMSIHTNTLVRCDGEVMTWWTVFAHQGEPPAKACRSWTFADDSTADDIEGILQELSEYMNYQV